MGNIKQGILGGFSGKVGTTNAFSPRISGISRIFLVHELARIGLLLYNASLLLQTPYRNNINPIFGAVMGTFTGLYFGNLT